MSLSTFISPQNERNLLNDSIVVAGAQLIKCTDKRCEHVCILFGSVIMRKKLPFDFKIYFPRRRLLISLDYKPLSETNVQVVDCFILSVDVQ